jgi:hypothetical protein
VALAKKPPILMSNHVARTAVRSGFTGKMGLGPLREKKMKSILDLF